MFETIIYEWEDGEFEYFLRDEDIEKLMTVARKDFLKEHTGITIEDEYELDELVEKYIEENEEDYKDIALEMFESKAIRTYNQNKEYQDDPFSYYGVSR